MFPKALILLLIILIACSTSLVGQNPPQQPPQPPSGGVSTGTPLNYTTRRTVGVTDPRAPIIFEDVTDKTALANFRHRSGSPAKNYLFEATSGSVAIFDYDGDGLPDIYLLNGSTMPAMEGKEPPPRAALYHNLGNWKFEDVTDKAGVANQRWGMGVAVGDYDNDGRPDIYVSNLGVSRLYHNNGDGTFTDDLGRLLVRLRRYDEALPLLKHGAELLKDDPGVHYQLFLVYSRQRAKTEADAELALFKKLEEARKTKEGGMEGNATSPALVTPDITLAPAAAPKPKP